MSAEAMLSFLQNCTPEARLGFKVVTQCAPVLKGVKISNLITVKPGGWQQIRMFLRKSRIICIPLYADQDREVLFLYRYEQLEAHLKRPEVRRFLRRFGYGSFEIAAVLKQLKRRYQQYAGMGREFPHELGVLLEYPVGDVEGFIANRGENSLAARYWKVYENPQEAERIFRLYDEAREQALEEIIQGYPLYQVAVS
ncbi:DUF3793 family protein [Clostridium sp. AN503]|mgnify:CR=1 FL=1|uniref:DUF3793 family protein n=1 Tax=Clostridium sp. AN503 TaxID=3160598 RepID=UPI00345B286E